MSIPIFSFRGSHLEIGRQHGEALKEGIAAFAAYRLSRCVQKARAAGSAISEEKVLDLAGQHLKPIAHFAPDLLEELEGMSETSEVSLERLVVLNGYTDFVDTLLRCVQVELGKAPAPAHPHECTAFYAGPEATRGGKVYVGQTWDMDGEAEKYVVALRLEILGKPPCVLLTHAGGLGLAGLNKSGIGVAINNLVPKDARLGVPFPFLVRSVLDCDDFDNAFLALTQVRFSSGHNYVLSDAEGRSVNIETTGEECEVVSIETPVYAHANHYTCETLKPLAAELAPGSTTCEREARMRQLLEERAGSLDVATLHACLSDPKVEVVPPGRSSVPGDPPVWSCATAIFDLTERAAYLRKGHPSQGPLRRFDFATEV